MKPRHFKIRNAQSGAEEHPRIRKGHQSNTIIPIGQSQYADDDTQFRDFFKMFKTIMDKEKKARVQPENHYKSEMQPRDREIIIQPPTIFNDVIEEKQLKKWIASVCKTVCSASFNYYTKKQMNFQQAKIFCSQNVFKNIANLSKHYTLNAKQLQIIDHHIQSKVLSYLETKYPLTDSTNINKKLEEIIHEVDNIQSLPNNYINSTSVQFEYRDDGNYNDLIMKLINELMEYLDEQLQQQVTTYHQFQQFMTNIFEKVMDQDWMRKNDKDGLSSLKLSHLKSDLGSPVNQQSKLEKQYGDNNKDKNSKKAQEKEKYRAAVKEYTHYLIGRKISENTPKYTQKEIQSKNMPIKSPTILRILTKWCEQLWQKYSQVGFFANRSQSIKVLKGGNINSLLDWMRIDIDSRLQLQKQEIIKFTKEIEQNNYEMQSKILKMQLSMQDYDYIQQLQKVCGKFSTKVVKNVHSYIIAYLNRLVHGLMSAAKNFHSEHNLGTFSFWPSPPNLLTLRVGDLMRCKISSKQKQIVRIYREIQKISKQMPQKFKIIRIKNRMKKGTNDILINFKFNNSIICQVQLAVKGYTSDFIKCSNNYHHYLYELRRSNFGPLTQLCSIWNNLDKRVAVYQQMIEQQKNNHKSVDHVCKKLSKKSVMKMYQRPFICSECSMAFFHNNYLKNHLKCMNCEFYVCANCQILKKAQNIIIQQLIQNKELRSFIVQVIDKKQKLPRFGICIFLESKFPKPEYFQYLNFEKDKKDYLFGKKDDLIYQIQNIESSKSNKQFRRRHLIFEIKQQNFPNKLNEDEIKTHLMTKMMKSNFKKQKESISLMGQCLNTQACKQILSVGTKYQKENVKNLFLTDNQLTELPISPQEYPNLQWITLSRNYGVSLEGISGLSKLKNFILVAGGLNKIPDQLYEATSLQEITLNDNGLTEIQGKISKLKKIRILQLDDNSLTALPKQISECKFLTELKMQRNSLQQLPQEFFELTNLQILLLGGNQFTNLSDSIGKLSQLKHLDLSKNYSLTTLPQAIINCKNLQKLNLNSIAITQLHANFFNLDKLVELNLSSTQISQIPQNISNLTKLQKLQLGYLSIQNISQVGNSKNLKHLDLNNCNMGGVPIQLSQLILLDFLDLSCNQIRFIPHQTFLKMATLNKLYLQNNFLTDFPNLQNQKYLIDIDLSINQITEIPNQKFQNCKDLQKFIMQSNKLTHLPYCFKNFNKLMILDLKYNQLSSFMLPEYDQQLNNIQNPIWPKLFHLFLNQNNLTYLPKYVCMNPNITDLYFSNNSISIIPPQVAKIKRLKQLEANNNFIKQLPQQITSLQFLIGIYMSDNQIKVVPKFIEKIPKLETLYFNNCNIQAVECIDWLLQNEYNKTLGSLPNLAYKFKYGKQRYEEVNYNQVAQINADQNLGQKEAVKQPQRRAENEQDQQE